MRKRGMEGGGFQGRGGSGRLFECGYTWVGSCLFFFFFLVGYGFWLGFFGGNGSEIVYR